MTQQQPSPVRPQTMRQWVMRWSLNDWLLLAYLGFLTYSVATATPRGPTWERAMVEMTSLLAVFITLVLVLVRGGLLQHRWLGPFLFRAAHFCGLLLTYFFMRGFLPLVNPHSLDRVLYEFDLAVFGVEPSIAMQSWISPLVTEWFAYFYYGYFFLLGLHALPLLLFGKNKRITAEFALGMFFVLGVGQSLYVMVPGFGPSNGMPELFHQQLPSGVWWDRVVSIVRAGGAQKDIFPSIHTAAPTFLLLFSFHNRHYPPYRYTWPALTLFVSNIIVATLYLRWHWLADVLAGLALAFFAHVASVYGSAWEARRRQRTGAGDAWPSWHY